MKKEDVVVISNQLATREQIIDRLLKIAAVENLERCIIYFSGHGGLVDRGDSLSGCILPFDAIQSSDGVIDIESVITVQQLSEYLSNIRTRQQLLILDCCHAAASGLGSRGDVWSSSSTGFSTDLLDRTARSMGEERAILVSCKQDEYSYVSASGVSYFTSALLSGLSGNCKHNQGEVFISDLAKYIKESVEKDTGKLQSPQSYVINDFPVVRLAIPKCPYPGWESYDGKNLAHPFCGREKEEKELISAITKPGGTAIIGGSGVGKSSLVLAGLIPKLRVRGIETYSTRPSSGDIERQLEKLSEKKQELLFIDQFEEFFALDIEEQERLDECLSNYLAKNKIRLLLSVRGDLYSDLKVTRIGKQCLLFDLYPLEREQLKEVISRPARDCGVTISEALVTQLIEDLREEKGALPLLQAVLEKLWATLEPGQQEIGLETYEKNICERKEGKRISGIVRSLSQRADEVYRNELKTDDEKRIARSIFLKLIYFIPARGVVRWQLSRPELAKGLVSGSVSTGLDKQSFGIVLNKLLKGRLVAFKADEATSRTTGDSPEVDGLLENVDGMYSVTHEALIHHWPEYQTWIRNFRQHEVDRLWLQGKTDAWLECRKADSKRADSCLLSKAELVRAKASLSNEYATVVRPSTQAKELFEISRIRVRNERILVAVVIAVFVSIGVLAVWQVKRAREEANTSRLVTKASEQMQLHPHISLLLLIDAMRRGPSIEASMLLRECVDRLAPHWHQIREASRVCSLAVNEGGKKLFVFTERNGVHLVDIEKRSIASERRFDLGKYSSTIYDKMVASPDGNWFCCFGSCGLKLYRADSSTPVSDIDVSVQAVVFSPDSSHFSFADFDHVYLYRLGQKAERIALFPGPIGIRAMGVGKRRLVAVAGNSIYSCDIASKEVRKYPSAHLEKVCVSKDDDFVFYSRQELAAMPAGASAPVSDLLKLGDSEPIYFARFEGSNRIIVKTSLRNITLDNQGNVLFADGYVQDSAQKFTIDNDGVTLLRAEPEYFGRNVAAKNLIATISDDQTVTLWEPDSSEVNGISDISNSRVIDGRYLLAPSKTSGLRLFDLVSGSMLWRLGFEKDYSFSGVLSNTHKFIAIPSRGEVSDFAGHTMFRYSNRFGFEPSFSKDDSLFISSEREFEVTVHSVRNGTSKTYSCPLEWRILAAKFSDVEPNKIILQLGSENESILQFLNTEKNEITVKPSVYLGFKRWAVALCDGKFIGHDESANTLLIDDSLQKENAIEFPPLRTDQVYRIPQTGDIVFSLGAGVSMLNLRDRPLRWKKLEVPGRVEYVTASSDGRYVLAKGERIFVFEPARSIYPIVALDGLMVSACSFIGDGSELIIARPNSVKRIRWSVKDLLKEASATAVRNLSQGEWSTYEGATPYRRIIKDLPEPPNQGR